MENSGALPLYERVKEALHRDIEVGKYRPGEKIPPEPELEKIYLASRITIRRAVAELCRQGLLMKKQGRGTFVAAPLLHRCIVSGKVFEGFSRTCLSQGIKPGARPVKTEIVPASLVERECLKLPEGSMLIHVQRVRTADGVPVYLENMYLPYEIYADILKVDLQDASLFETMQELTGRVPAGVAYRSIGATRAEHEQAELLGIALGEPMLFMKVVYTDGDGKLLCIGRQYYVGSRYVFESYDSVILDNLPMGAL